VTLAITLPQRQDYALNYLRQAYGLKILLLYIVKISKAILIWYLESF